VPHARYSVLRTIEPAAGIEEDDEDEAERAAAAAPGRIQDGGWEGQLRGASAALLDRLKAAGLA
jgi:hypothetical protein